MHEVLAYLEGHFSKTQGWCVPQLWQCIQPLHDIVVASGGGGPIAEIGVYHGKFFIGLLKTMRAPQNNYAFDVFDLQQFNLDGAGKGNLEKFQENLAACDVPPGSVEIFKTNSMWLNRGDIERIRQTSGGFSMFSVDGCHLAEHTVNDIQIATELTRPPGLIFVDDYYNANWPGVQEGVAKYFHMQSPRFVPLVYTCNKLVLCNISYHRPYLKKVTEFVRETFTGTETKMVKRFGFDCLNTFPKVPTGRYLHITRDSPASGTPLG